jgi:hypothetical protein
MEMIARGVGAVVIVLRIPEVSFFHQQNQNPRSRALSGNREDPPLWCEKYG